jgi:hypothetical protein
VRKYRAISIPQDYRTASRASIITTLLPRMTCIDKCRLLLYEGREQFGSMYNEDDANENVKKAS